MVYVLPLVMLTLPVSCWLEDQIVNVSWHTFLAHRTAPIFISLTIGYMCMEVKRWLQWVTSLLVDVFKSHTHYVMSG